MRSAFIFWLCDGFFSLPSILSSMGRPNFIDPVDPVYSGMHYPDDLDAARRDVTSYLGMRNMVVDGRVDLRRTTVGADCCLQGSRVGDLYAWALKVGGILDLQKFVTDRNLYLYGAQADEGIDAQQVVVEDQAHLAQVTAPYADFRGAAITRMRLDSDIDTVDLGAAHVCDLVVDDLDRYEILVDEHTRLWNVQEGVYGIRDVHDLTEKEETVLDMIVQQDKPVFTRQDLNTWLDNDPTDTGAFGSLVKKRAALPLNDTHYCLNTDYT